MPLNTEIKLQDVTDRLYSPTTCSAVLVGGDRLSDLHILLERIHSFADDMIKPPLAILLFTTEPMDMTNIQYQLDSPIVRN